MVTLEFHPLSNIFPLMEGVEFEELVADIKARGLREKIDLYEGKIVDGRNRYRALQRLGIVPDANYFRKAIYTHSIGGEIAPHEGNNDDRVRAYVISKNIHRRHLIAEQRRGLIAELLKAQPEKPDRQIAKTAKDFKIFYQKVPGRTPGTYSIDHTAGAFVFDRDGRLRLFIRHGTPPADIAADIRRLS